jgi:hypothetical protein
MSFKQLKYHPLKAIVFLLMILIFINACSSKDKMPNDIIVIEKMRAILWDDTRAQVYAKEIISKDSTKNDALWYAAMQDKIFAHYKVTKERYNKSYNYYALHPELFIQITDSIQAKQSRVNDLKQNNRKPIFFQ